MDWDKHLRVIRGCLERADEDARLVMKQSDTIKDLREAVKPMDLDTKILVDACHTVATEGGYAMIEPACGRPRIWVYCGDKHSAYQHAETEIGKRDSCAAAADLKAKDLAASLDDARAGLDAWRGAAFAKDREIKELKKEAGRGESYRRALEIATAQNNKLRMDLDCSNKVRAELEEERDQARRRIEHSAAEIKDLLKAIKMEEATANALVDENHRLERDRKRWIEEARRMGKENTDLADVCNELRRTKCDPERLACAAIEAANCFENMANWADGIRQAKEKAWDDGWQTCCDGAAKLDPTNPYSKKA